MSTTAKPDSPCADASETVFDLTCYPREFQDVDIAWQLQVTAKGNACLKAHGEPLPEDGELMQSALTAAKLTPEQCGIY